MKGAGKVTSKSSSTAFMPVGAGSFAGCGGACGGSRSGDLLFPNASTSKAGGSAAAVQQHSSGLPLIRPTPQGCFNNTSQVAASLGSGTKCLSPSELASRTQILSSATTKPSGACSPASSMVPPFHSCLGGFGLGNEPQGQEMVSGGKGQVSKAFAMRSPRPPRVPSTGRAEMLAGLQTLVVPPRSPSAGSVPSLGDSVASSKVPARVGGGLGLTPPGVREGDGFFQSPAASSHAPTASSTSSSSKLATTTEPHTQQPDGAPSATTQSQDKLPPPAAAGGAAKQSDSAGEEDAATTAVGTDGQQRSRSP